MTPIPHSTAHWTSDQVFFVLMPVLFALVALFLMLPVPVILSEAGLPPELKWGIYLGLGFGALCFFGLALSHLRDARRYHAAERARTERGSSEKSKPAWKGRC